MNADEPTDAPLAAGEAVDQEEPQSVFGNLPKRRPGARSPRRGREASARGAREEPAPARGRAPGAGPRAPGRRPEAEAKPPPPEAPGEGPAAEPAGAGIEDVAWAGVAAAAEAATIGVRLATRALEAMRDAVDRR
jgi:hypothetical protein